MFDEQTELEKSSEQQDEDVFNPVSNHKEMQTVKKQRPRPLGMIRAIKDLDVLTSSDIEVKKRLIETAKENPKKNADTDSGWVSSDAQESESVNDEIPDIGTDEFERMKQELLAEVRAIIAQGITMSIQQNPNDELIALVTHCAIPGHVVHTISHSGDIEEHFTRNDMLEFELDIARSYLIRDTSQNISHIEAFKQHLQVVYQSGAVETVSVY